MEDPDLQKSTWQLRCPCKDELSTKREDSRLSISKDILDTMIIKKEAVGDFFFDKDWPIFQNIIFRPKEEYNWNFLLQSPFRFFIDINSKCNLSCLWCYFWEKGKEEMSYWDFQKIVDSIVAANSVGIQLLWGEPTLHPELYEMCKYAKEKWLKVEIISNWYRVDDLLLDKLEGLVDLFWISIDWDEDIHNQLRWKKDSYSKAVSTYTKLKEHGYFTKIIMTINKLNYKKLSHVASLCDDKTDLEVKNIVCNGLDTNDLSLTKEIKIEVKKQLLDLDLSRNATPIGFDDIKNTAFYWCPWWAFTWSIDVYGNAYSCIYMRGKEQILWNVLSASVLDIWEENNKRILEEKPEKCLSCWFLKYCWWKCYLK